MKTSVPPAAIRAPPASITAHPSPRRSVEKLETALGVLPLIRREALLLVSCIIEKIPLIRITRFITYDRSM
ncbi:MAG TPA: hypothetical protein VK512_22330 [Xanthobacteraceae bacterium]|nr:hypothetical protein [Xanthobacteraceae bacterium]